MNEKRCRRVGLMRKRGGGTSSRDEKASSRHPGGCGRGSIGFLAMLVVLGAGLIQPGRSRAQEAPGAVEVPKEAAPPPARDAVEPLGLRYRFIETYGVAENPAKPELVTQYQVGLRDTIRTETEKAQGAPDRSEGSILLIYTERPAQVTKPGETTDVVRRYDQIRTEGALKAPHATPPLLQGLNIWYHVRKGGFPEVISMSEGRTLHEWERYVMIDQVFLPSLTVILPAAPKRVGDTWDITRQAGRSLLGRSVPDDGAFQLEGTLKEVRKAAAGTTLTAVFEISGELALEKGQGAVKARVEFTFEPPPAASDPAPAVRAKAVANRGIVEARGRISSVKMGRVLWIPIDNNGRIKQTIYRDLVLERRPVKPPTPPLDLPSSPPIANQANSWVLYDDPHGRFHFTHPQYLVPKPGDSFNPNGVDLVDQDLGRGEDVIRIMLPPKGGSPQSMLDYRSPDAMVRTINDYLNEAGSPIVPGHSGWLPEADWARLGRKVYHHEVAAKLEGQEDGREHRLYLDYYLVLFRRDVGIRIDVMTRRDDHAAFREQALTLIKSLDLEPSKGSGSRTAPGAGGALRPDQGQAPDAVGTPPASAGTSPAGRAAAPVPPIPPR
jgi:hypothetical protein